LNCSWQGLSDKDPTGIFASFKTDGDQHELGCRINGF